VRTGRFVRISGLTHNRFCWISARTKEAFAEMLAQFQRIDGVSAQIERAREARRTRRGLPF
jgi:hypothetical protein